MTKLKMESKDMTQYNIEQIAQMFPQVVTEVADPSGAKDEDGKPMLKKAIDFEKLKLVLSAGTGDYVVADDEREHYEFTWVGKRQSMIDAATPIRKTLRPCVEDSKNWDTTENLYIEGDNLEVLKLLQESYLGKVKMIYIDPPYNTGNDFVYKDNFTQDSEEYNEELGMYDEEDNRLFQNTETNGRFHSDWCSMIYPRLQLARNLLTDDGVVFISIDDNEVENLKKICDEVFGASNFIANMVWQSTAGSNTGTDIVTVTENIIVYVKSRNIFRFDGKISSKDGYILSDKYEEERGKYGLDKMDRRRVGNHYSDALNYPITMPDGSIRYPGGFFEKSKNGWNYLWSKTKVEWGIKAGFIEFKKNNGDWSVYNKRYFNVDNEGNPIERAIPFRNLITSGMFNTAQGTSEVRSLFINRPFDFPKPSELIKYLLSTSVRSNKDSIILDFFSGSATTAHAVMQLNAEDGGNRKFIMVQLPEKTEEKSEAHAEYKNICEIGKERIRRAGEKIDKVRIDRINKEAQKEGVVVDIVALDTGFRVFKTDSTNMKDVYYAAGDISQATLFDMVSNIKEDRSDIDLLYGCLLDWGVPLSQPHRSETIDGSIVHFVNDTNLVACFDDKVTEQTVREIAKLKPLRALFRDHSFEGSANKINVYEIFKSISPNTSVKVI